MHVGRVAVTYVSAESIYKVNGNRYAAQESPNHANYR
jgi:hypothetical protein